MRYLLVQIGVIKVRAGRTREECRKSDKITENVANPHPQLICDIRLDAHLTCYSKYVYLFLDEKTPTV